MYYCNMISKEEIQNLAELSRLKISDEETVTLQKDISSILDYVGQVNAAQLGGEDTKPLLRNVMRDDVPRVETDPLSGKRESLLSALPKREGDYNVVRKIISKDE